MSWWGWLLAGLLAALALCALAGVVVVCVQIERLRRLPAEAARFRAGLPPTDRREP